MTAETRTVVGPDLRSEITVGTDVLTETTLRYRPAKGWIAIFRNWTTAPATTPTNALRELAAEIRAFPDGSPEPAR